MIDTKDNSNIRVRSREMVSFRLKTGNPGQEVALFNQTAHVSDDNSGKKLWWFGGKKKTPTPAEFLSRVKTDTLRKFQPPWAALLYLPESNEVFVATDPIGLRHLYHRKIGFRDYFGVGVFDLAGAAQVNIDPLAAYEMFARGNPQGERTVFKEISIIPPASLFRFGEQSSFVKYWKPGLPAPLDRETAIREYTSAVAEAVADSYDEDEDVQELTAGRDSLLVASAILHNGSRGNAWTHGLRDCPDLNGAVRRAKRLGMRHTSIKLEPVLELEPDHCFDLIEEYARASGGGVDAVKYGHLPFVLRQVPFKSSITGVGGEVFRGFYHQWAGKGMIPSQIGKQMMLHGKIRAEMPMGNPVIRKEIRLQGDEVIKNDVFRHFERGQNDIWHHLDVYYLMNRMHYFAGLTFSSVFRWMEVRAPLFDWRVLDCLPKVPIEMKSWTGGLVQEATSQLLPTYSELGERSHSHETPVYRFKKLAGRSRQLRGGEYQGFSRDFFRIAMKSRAFQDLLVLDDMATLNLYNPDQLRKLIKTAKDGGSPELLGSILTMELAARMGRAPSTPGQNLI